MISLFRPLLKYWWWWRWNHNRYMTWNTACTDWWTITNQKPGHCDLNSGPCTWNHQGQRAPCEASRTACNCQETKNSLVTNSFQNPSVYRSSHLRINECLNRHRESSYEISYSQFDWDLRNNDVGTWSTWSINPSNVNCSVSELASYLAFSTCEIHHKSTLHKWFWNVHRFALDLKRWADAEGTVWDNPPLPAGHAI